MKKKLLTLVLFLSASAAAAQQIFMTRNAQISFFSKTPVENIDAVNNEVTSILNAENGELVYAVLIKSFRFEKALMEEHFNENYMESAKYPKAIFSGKVINLGEIDFSRDGKYTVRVEGDLTIHGVKRPVSASGLLEVTGRIIAATSTFLIRVEDYNIKVPSLVTDKIAETIEVKVNCRYEPRI